MTCAPVGLPDPAPSDPAIAIAAQGLILQMEGWEGPLESLLDLARARKIDLARISLLALVDQYLAHVEGQDRPRLEIAAEYLVMAAWLAFLKSAALLPADLEPEPEAAVLAAHAAHRAARLAAMRDAAALLDLRPRLTRDRHARGAPEGLTERTRALPTANLNALLTAYARVRTRAAQRRYTPARRPIVTMAQALAHLAAALPRAAAWTELARLLPPTSALARSGTASTLAAALELTRVGKAALRQRAPFAPIELQRR